MSDPYNPQPGHQPGQFPAPGQSGFPQPGLNPPTPGPAFGAPGGEQPTYGQPNFGQPGSGQPNFGQPNFGQPNFGGPGQNSPIVGEQPPSKRSRGKMIGALVGVVAVAAAGTFAFTQLRSNDSDGGAADAEELGTSLVEALDNEDILGAVDLLLPGERDTFRQPMIDFVDELKRLEITDETADLSKVGGFDIVLENPEIDVEDTNVDDISIVTVTADSTVTVNGDELPIGDFVLENILGGERPEIDEETDSQFAVTFASVEQDGRWYISLFHSAANAIVGSEDIPEEGIVARGADSPEGALSELVEYTSNLDIEGIIASLNPNEAAALQRYAPLFIDDAQDALDDIDIAWKISDVEYSVDGSGNRRQVGVDSFHFEAQVDGRTVEFDWADGCLVGTAGDGEGEFDSCTAFDDDGDSTFNDYLDQAGVEQGRVRDLFNNATEAFSDFSLQGVVVDKVDGRWYVSPIGTGAEAFLAVLRAVDRDDIETFINDVSAILDGGLSMPDIDLPDDSPATTIPDTVPDTVPEDTIPDTVPDTVPDVSTPDVSIPDVSIPDVGESSWISCLFDYTEAAEVTACVTAGVDSGEFDPSFISAALLYPECGLAEYYLADESSTDDPATFLATIEPGRACIVDAAAADGIDLLFNGPEFLHPECFTQDNPYNFEEPDEVDGYECAYAAG